MLARGHPGEHEDQKIVVVGVGDAGIENVLALCEKNEVSIVNSGTEFPRAQARNQDLLYRAIAAKVRELSGIDR